MLQISIKDAKRDEYANITDKINKIQPSAKMQRDQKYNSQYFSIYFSCAVGISPQYIKNQPRDAA